MRPNALQRIELAVVRGYTAFLNALLSALEKLLFRPLTAEPKNILIFKGGNIGDIVCAIPLFIAIRRTYPKAHITLMTSPGMRGIPGAPELLTGAWFLDAIEVYDSKDIDSWVKLRRFGERIQKRGYDLFIHVPVHDWMKFRTFVRNMLFIRLMGFRHAFGFRVRTVIRLFRKTQLDYTFETKEVESLLELFRKNGIRADRVEFDFPVSAADEIQVEELLKKQWPDFEKWSAAGGLLVGLHDGSKRKEKQWPPERFGEMGRYLENAHHARFVILGGPADRVEAAAIKGFLASPEDALIVAGELSILEVVALLRRVSFLLCIDSGMMHIAGALGKPTVGLFSILGVLGRWHPYGDNHEGLFHRFLKCNYHTVECVRESMEAITVPEVKAACDRVIRRLHENKGRTKKNHE